MRFTTLKKKNKITTVNVLLLLLIRSFRTYFSTSNSVIFVDGGRKNISCPRAQGTLATPLLNTVLENDVKESWKVLEFNFSIAVATLNPIKC